MEGNTSEWRAKLLCIRGLNLMIKAPLMCSTASRCVCVGSLHNKQDCRVALVVMKGLREGWVAQGRLSPCCLVVGYYLGWTLCPEGMLAAPMRCVFEHLNC